MIKYLTYTRKRCPKVQYIVHENTMYIPYPYLAVHDIKKGKVIHIDLSQYNRYEVTFVDYSCLTNTLTKEYCIGCILQLTYKNTIYITYDVIEVATDTLAELKATMLWYFGVKL